MPEHAGHADGQAPPRVCSFAPVARADARILILGSMPGTASLEAGQYYAHPHNQFWRIIAAVYGQPWPLAPYRRRLATLLEAQLALWDVLQSCVRVGSLDSAIERSSVYPNDIPRLLQQHARIERVCCNGATAYTTLRRHFGAALDALGVEVRALPSTSPANARQRPELKLAAWREALSAPLTQRSANRSAH